MLTVLVRYQKTGVENVRQAFEVEYYPPTTGAERDHAGLLMRNSFEDRDGSFLGLTPIGDENYRDVFVMNDKGATVARYTL